MGKKTFNHRSGSPLVPSDQFQNKVIAESRHPKPEKKCRDPRLGALQCINNSTRTAQILQKHCRAGTARTDCGAKRQ